MQTAVAGFSPAFAPADASLAPAAFLTFLGTLDTLNTEVGTLSSQYTNGVEQRTPKAPTPGEGPGSPPAKKRNKGEQSFGDFEENFERLIAALAAVPGYAPPATDLTIANLTTLATDFASKNLTMSTLGNTLGMKQKLRLDGYDGPGGLREKMNAIKSAVRSQYGTDSAKYEQVTEIKK